MTPSIQFRRKPKIPKAPIIALSVVAAAVIVAVAVLIIVHVVKEKKEAESIGKCTWSTEGFENISDAKVLDETVIVFTDSKSQKKGIMTLDGKITEKAIHESIYVVSSEWRNKQYVVKNPEMAGEELLCVEDDFTVKTSPMRQYRGSTEPEKTPYWEEKHNHFAWHDANGYKIKVKSNEVSLGDGLYPVSCPPSDGSKWGYIDNSLKLKIVLNYEKAMDFSEGYAAVCKDGKWGYIDESGVTKINFDFESVSELDVMGENMAFAFRNGLAPVKKDGKYGIINTSGEVVVEYVFDAILQGKNGVYVAKKDGEWGIITINKEQLTVKTEATSVQSDTNGGAPVNTGNYIVKTSGSPLNMRNEPNGEIVVAQIPNGDSITVSKSVSGWAYAQYGRFQGWVSAQYIEKAPATTQAPAPTAAVTQ